MHFKQSMQLSQPIRAGKGEGILNKDGKQYVGIYDDEQDYLAKPEPAIPKDFTEFGIENIKQPNKK